MPTTTRETVLSRYRYDPLDRLSTQTDIQRFYCNNRLATEVGGGVQTSLFQHDDQLLAQRQARADKIDTTLLATDQQRSVLNALDATRPHAIAYSPYGYRPPENGLLSLLGFNGERPDPVTGHYHLGNGYRQFNPVLMRFNSPDSWSPFGKGGLNAYVYCVGDPVNFSDPTGHMLKGKGPIVAPAAATKSKNLIKQKAKLLKKIDELEKKEVETIKNLRAIDENLSKLGDLPPSHKTKRFNLDRLTEIQKEQEKQKVEYSDAFTLEEQKSHLEFEKHHTKQQIVKTVNSAKSIVKQLTEIEENLSSQHQLTAANSQLNKNMSAIRHPNPNPNPKQD